MRRHLDVLVVESRPGMADEAAAVLAAAGHRVHRCFGPGESVCRAMHEPESCPLDVGIDVALVVRNEAEPDPTPYEVGVSCAIRSHIPVAEQGPREPDPFDRWVTHRVGDEGVADAVATAADRGFDALRRDIVEHIGTVMPSRAAATTVVCEFERIGHRMVVHLHGPAVGDRVEKAVAVRVLDAMWRSGRTFGQVDVAYHAPGPDVPATEPAPA